MEIAAKKNYLTMSEAAQHLNELNIKISESELEYYAEVGTLKLSLHVGSRPAYAAQYNSTDNEMTFIGHCEIHGIFLLETGDACALISKKAHLIEILPGYPHASHLEITNWSTELPRDAQRMNLGFDKIWKPEPLSANLKYSILFFYLRPQYYLQLNEVNPGQFMHVNLIPEDILATALKFNLGTPKQIPENQVFKKSDLRVTKENLASFIEILTPKQLIQVKSDKDDKRFTDKSEALSMLARHIRNNGKGMGYTQFERMLEDHSADLPYDGVDCCSKIYLKQKTMHFTYVDANGNEKKGSIAISSMKYHFKKAKK